MTAATISVLSYNLRDVRHEALGDRMGVKDPRHRAVAAA
jgi:hypothetical protein